MSLVDQLKDVIRERKAGRDPDAWIRDWLFVNELNRGRLIPTNAPVTLITGIQMLFEFPWQAVCQAAEAAAGHSASLAAYVCVSDSGTTEILIVDLQTSKIVHFWKKEAWKFRFKTTKDLELWMEVQVITLLKAIGKEEMWRKSAQKQKP